MLKLFLLASSISFIATFATRATLDGGLASNQSFEKCAGQECVPPLAEHPNYCFPSQWWGLLRTGKIFGEGAFARVRNAYQLPECKEIAAKVADLDKMKKEKVIAEFNLQHRLHHPGVLAVYATGRAQGPLGNKWNEQIIFMEPAAGGDLLNRMQRPMSVSEARKYMAEMSDALAYVHSQSVAHKDIKFDNTLLTSDDHTKIADFGLAEYLPNHALSTRFAGTPIYADPEIFKGQPFDAFKADVFSLGVTFFSLLTGEVLWKKADNRSRCFQKWVYAQKAVMKPSISSVFGGCYGDSIALPSGMDGLISSMLAVDPQKRPRMKEVHDWLKDSSSSLLQELDETSSRPLYNRSDLQRQEATFNLLET